MSFFEDESGQGAAEYLLIFAGVIIIAIAALLIYNAYFNSNNPYNAANDSGSVRANMTNITNNTTGTVPTPGKVPNPGKIPISPEPAPIFKF